VSKTIQRLQREGLVTSQPYRSIFLTPTGLELARAAKERHALVYGFLLALGVDPGNAEADTEGIEHHVSTQTLDAMKAFLKSKNL